MPENGELKSAYELAMERLRKQDRETGVEERRVSDEQRAAIADVRRICEAKLAEREILHNSKLAASFDPEERERLETDYRRDRERLLEERDAKIESLRRAEG